MKDSWDYARKIPLLEMRKKLLEKHEDLGIIRQHSDNYYATLTADETKLQCTKLHEMIDSELKWWGSSTKTEETQ